MTKPNDSNDLALLESASQAKAAAKSTGHMSAAEEPSARAASPKPSRVAPARLATAATPAETDATAPVEPSLARRAQPSTIRRGDDAAAAFDRLARQTAAMAAHNLRATLASDAPEGPHQLRVALRRLRVLLNAFRAVIAPDLRRAVTDEAREIARHVGEIRQLDVMSTDLLAPFPDAETAEVRAALAQRRRTAATAFRTRGEAARAAALTLDLGEALAAKSWRRTDKTARRIARQRARRIGAATLDRAWARAAAWGARFDALDIEERHELRKAVKKLRYSFAFFAPLYAEQSSTLFAKRMARLQNKLGYLNDAAESEALRDLAPAPELSPIVQRVVAHHSAAAEKAWLSAKTRWADLAEAAKPWRR